MGLFDSPTHILIVLVVLVVLFGSAKLPKAAKSMGEAMRIFKKEAAKLHDDDETPAATSSTDQNWNPQHIAQQPAPQLATPTQQPSHEQQVAALQQQMAALQQQMNQAKQAMPQPTVVQQPAENGAPLPETQQTNQPG
jgi:sec-independent protein translocase protein TatA